MLRGHSASSSKQVELDAQERFFRVSSIARERARLTGVEDEDFDRLLDEQHAAWRSWRAVRREPSELSIADAREMLRAPLQLRADPARTSLRVRRMLPAESDELLFPAAQFSSSLYEDVNDGGTPLPPPPPRLRRAESLTGPPTLPIDDEVQASPDLPVFVGAGRVPDTAPDDGMNTPT